MTSRSLRWLATVTVALVGCTSTPSSTQPTTSVPPAEAPAAVVTRPPAPAPEPTGVPGLAAADPFCAAWAGYAGTLQALSIAASFGDLASDRLAALELVAAPRLVEVAAAIEAAWPSELSGEREVVVEQRLGPYVRRAQSAVAALTDAAVSAAELATLSAAWQSALATRDPEMPVIAVPPVGNDLQAKVDAAAVAYDSARTPFAHDPSLAVSGVETPETDAYLAAHCPDLASSGVGDAL